MQDLHFSLFIDKKLCTGNYCFLLNKLKINTPVTGPKELNKIQNNKFTNV